MSAATHGRLFFATELDLILGATFTLSHTKTA
jgi:hypothetical protein